MLVWPIVPGTSMSALTLCRANNFLAWVRGPKADFDEWAEIVGDPWWRWDSVLPVMNEVCISKLSNWCIRIPADHKFRWKTSGPSALQKWKNTPNQLPAHTARAGKDLQDFTPVWPV